MMVESARAAARVAPYNIVRIEVDVGNDNEKEFRELDVSTTALEERANDAEKRKREIEQCAQNLNEKIEELKGAQSAQSVLDAEIASQRMVV